MVSGLLQSMGTPMLSLLVVGTFTTQLKTELLLAVNMLDGQN